MENKNITDKAKLKIDGKTVELNVFSPTIGPKCIDVRSLYKDTGYFTYDSGFLSTASCLSDITYIDGENGILRHRGYPIEQIADKLTFVELSYLLLYKKIPNKQESIDFDKRLTSLMFIDKGVDKIIKSFDRNHPPMAIMSSCMSYLAGKKYKNGDDDIDNKAVDIIAKNTIIAAKVARYITKQKFIEPSEELSFMENFVRSLLFKSKKEFQYSKKRKVLISTFDKLLCLHADHEQNASTSSVRMVNSTGVNMYAAISAGILALWGPLHGGANESVINMLETIGSVKNIPNFITKAKDKNDPFKLMGFGHRVYKEYDPRAKVIKSSCDEILKMFKDGHISELLEIAEKLEKIALKDEYFSERKLFPNVDFYSGVIYKAIGLQSNFFTVMFMVARTSGWVSQILEFESDTEKKISRPRQLYIGEVLRDI